jgi:hypothetical protein
MTGLDRTGADAIDRMRGLAERTGLRWKLDEHPSDASFRMGHLHGGGIELHVPFIQGDDGYVAYGLTSPGLPPDLYPDEVRNQFSVDQRSEEILATVESLITRRAHFAPRRYLGRFGRGRIQLPIDGQVRDIFVPRNYFGLPLA